MKEGEERKVWEGAKDPPWDENKAEPRTESAEYAKGGLGVEKKIVECVSFG